MTRTISALALAAFPVALALGCEAGEPPLTDDQRSAVEAEIDSVQTAFADAFRAADLDGGLAFFDDHPDFGFAFDAGSWSSIADVDRTFREMFDALERQEIRVDERRILVLSRNAAYAFERGAFTHHLRDGTSSGEIPFAITALWIRTDEGWRVRFAHESTAPPS
jgi:ketosteroid isomerase-like protein